MVTANWIEFSTRDSKRSTAGQWYEFPATYALAAERLANAGAEISATSAACAAGGYSVV